MLSLSTSSLHSPEYFPYFEKATDLFSLRCRHGGTRAGLTTEVAPSQGQALSTGQSPHDSLWPVIPTELLSPLIRGEVPQTKGPECSGASALPSPAREPAAELLFFVHQG